MQENYWIKKDGDKWYSWLEKFEIGKNYDRRSGTNKY